MATSKRIAGLVGPALVAVTVSETMNFHIFASTIAPVVYLNGTLLFLAGLSILQAHNRWTYRWPVIVTLAGWIAVLGGLFRMFAPEAQMSAPDAAKVAVTAIVFGIGTYLTFKAYSRENRKTMAR